RPALSDVQNRATREERIANREMRLAALIIFFTIITLSAAVREGESVAVLISKGNQFDKLLQPREALQFYLPANKIDPDNVDLLVPIARQYRHLMSDATSKQEKLRLGNISLGYADRAADLAPNNAEAQLSPAISYGKMLPYMSSRDQVDTSPKIKTS